MSIEAYWFFWGLVGIAVGVYGYIISRPDKHDKRTPPSSTTRMAFDSKPKGMRS